MLAGITPLYKIMYTNISLHRFPDFNGYPFRPAHIMVISELDDMFGMPLYRIFHEDGMYLMHSEVTDRRDFHISSENLKQFLAALDAYPVLQRLGI